MNFSHWNIFIKDYFENLFDQLKPAIFKLSDYCFTWKSSKMVEPWRRQTSSVYAFLFRPFFFLLLQGTRTNWLQLSCIGWVYGYTVAKQRWNTSHELHGNSSVSVMASCVGEDCHSPRYNQRFPVWRTLPIARKTPSVHTIPARIRCSINSSWPLSRLDTHPCVRKAMTLSFGLVTRLNENSRRLFSSFLAAAPAAEALRLELAPIYGGSPGPGGLSPLLESSLRCNHTAFPPRGTMSATRTRRRRQ